MHAQVKRTYRYKHECLCGSGARYNEIEDLLEAGKTAATDFKDVMKQLEDHRDGFQQAMDFGLKRLREKDLAAKKASKEK